MKNSFGQSVSLTVFGESHGAAVGCVIDGLAPGIEVSESAVARQLTRRRPCDALSTPRREKDEFKILSGVFNGKTTGTPVCIIIPNENTRSEDYTYGLARPAHADHAAWCKYHGFEDYRGGGHFSGRVTAAVVAAGGILLPALESLGISVGTHILSCGGVRDRAFGDIKAELEALGNKAFPVLDDERGEAMAREILKAREENDSVGGVTQTAVFGIPAGVGEPWFDSVESVISHAVFSIGGIKGIEFGAGFALSDMRGSEANDALRIKNGAVVTETNNNGGINGGITNGMPIVFNCAVKPTPSVSREQETVDFIKNENAKISIRGRHDPAIIRRICPVLDSVTALCLCDMLAQRCGTDALVKGVK